MSLENYKHLIPKLNLSGRKAFYNQGYYGQGITVAVIDSEINAEHQGFTGRILEQHSFIEDCERDMHGTAVASVVANSDMIDGEYVGVAPKVNVIGLKVSGVKRKPYLYEVAKACEWILKNHEKVDIVSLSISGQSDSSELRRVIKKLEEKNILVVCSAGNDGDSFRRYPATYSETISVGGVSINKKLTDYSSYGKTVDLVQLSDDIVVASSGSKDGYWTMSGTSFSQPICCGIACLLLCKYKSLFGKRMFIQSLRDMLFTNAQDLGDFGIDDKYGKGFCTLQPMNNKIIVKHGSREIVVNGKVQMMDTPTQIIDGRFMLPVRFLAENTGAYIVPYKDENGVQCADFRW